jgi:hypothetical protein
MAKSAWKRGFIGNSQERKMAPVSEGKSKPGFMGFGGLMGWGKVRSKECRTVCIGKKDDA